MSLTKPHWHQTAIATERGWVAPETGELLVACKNLVTRIEQEVIVSTEQEPVEVPEIIVTEEVIQEVKPVAVQEEIIDETNDDAEQEQDDLGDAEESEIDAGTNQPEQQQKRRGRKPKGSK